ncbi:N-acetyltransferase [Paenibacillus albiflavus]|uniref:N-acetyltransferase n=1 Tax=Paenibacillus albiflavus TaxID=2545760 RepID=A0A4V2WPP5_9BACL|nr:GNAT family N-acetyltransferase [Paenibacillus albiflavus]TCZ80142.1 N-acetyltransferase [Paenibacillus albiflavus]
MTDIVREATIQDLEQVWQLLKTRGATDSKELAEERILKVIASDDHYLLIAEYEDTIAGYAWAQNYGPHLRSGQMLFRFHDLFVYEQYRHKGIAASLLNSIIHWAKQSGASWLQWNANPTSSSFYYKLGYKSSPEEEEGFPFFELDFTADNK